MAGLRPYRSEKRPHGMPNKAWKSEKQAAQIPAHLPTSFWGMLKLCTISGRYGYSDVEASGSAKRHIAARKCGVSDVTDWSSVVSERECELTQNRKLLNG